MTSEEISTLKESVGELAERFMSIGGNSITLERPWQYNLFSSTEDREIYEKPRQVGFSFSIAGRTCLRAQLFPPSSYTGVFISINREEAREKIRYADMLYESMPKTHRKKITTRNKLEMEFANGNRIISYPARAVRGLPNVDLCFDEFAHIREARKIYDGSTASTIRGDYGITIGSTPYGRCFFDEILKSAGKGDFKRYKRRVIYWWDSPVLCTNVPIARLCAPGMTTVERVNEFGSERLLMEFESTDLTSFQREFECFIAGTDVITRDGVKNIEDIKIGDYVLTHTGRYRRVIRTMSKQYEGDLQVISSAGSGIPISCTPDHPFYEQYYRTDISRGNLGNSVSYNWKGARELRTNTRNENLADRVTFPRIKLGNNKIISQELATLIGWYIPEGSYSYNNLQFSLNSNEVEEAAEISRCIRVITGKTPEIYLSESGTGQIINCCNVELGEFLSRECGSGAHNKHIPFHIITGWEQLVYDCMIKGDGCCNDQGMKRGDSYITVSKSLAYQTQLISHALGYRASITNIKVPPKKMVSYNGKFVWCNTVINGKPSNAGPRYQVNIYKSRGQQSKTQLRSHCNTVSASVTGNDATPYSGLVYNLEVEIDNSYTANGRIVHNCNSADFGNSVLNEEQILDRVSAEIPCWIMDADCSNPDIMIDEDIRVFVDMMKMNRRELGRGDFREVYMGVDIGREVNATEIILGSPHNAKLETCGYITLRRTSWPYQKAVLRYLMDNLPIKRGSIDHQGIGNQLTEEMVLQYSSRIHPMDFTELTKAEMVATLLKYFEDKNVIIYPTQRIMRQLTAVKKITSINGRILYHSATAREGESGDKIYKTHADLFWAMAQMIWAHSDFTKRNPNTTRRSPALVIPQGATIPIMKMGMSGMGRRFEIWTPERKAA